MHMIKSSKQMICQMRFVMGHSVNTSSLSVFFSFNSFGPFFYYWERLVKLDKFLPSAWVSKDAENHFNPVVFFLVEQD